MNFAPYTRAEYSRDLGIRVRHYATPFDTGTTLAENPFTERLTDPRRAFDANLCETALRNLGWTTTSTWTPKRAMMIATVERAQDTPTHTAAPTGLTTAQAAAIAGRTARTIRRWIAAGKLTAVKAGRAWIITSAIPAI